MVTTVVASVGIRHRISAAVWYLAFVRILYLCEFSSIFTSRHNIQVFNFSILIDLFSWKRLMRVLSIGVGCHTM